MNLKKDKFIFTFNKKELIFCFSVAAFLFYALILALPSGYSYGAILCCLCGLLFVKKPECNRVGVAVAIYLIICGFFFLTWESAFFSKNDLELFSKYLICAFLSFILIGKYFSVRIMVCGMCAGALICFGLSFYQFEAIGRAEGFTNAIRYGNISALISVWLFIFGFLSCFSKRERYLIFFFSLLAIGSSLLSLSRGGWLVYVVAGVMALVFLNKEFLNKKIIMIFLGIFALLFWFSNGAQRIQVAINQTSDFFSQADKSASTSVGARLEMYRFAIDVISEKPIIGWGDKSIRNELEKRVERKEYDEYLLTQPHLHNEILDTFARRGIVGGLGLFFIYVAPIFYLLLLKREESGNGGGGDIMLLNLAICMLPISYMIFGLTDLFFHINISHMFYAFSILFLFATRVSYLNKFNK